MARLLLMHGRDPLVRQLAEQIIAEIASMHGRIADHQRAGGQRSSDYPALGGTRGSAPMQ
jgi:hypothetical protein